MMALSRVANAVWAPAAVVRSSEETPAPAVAVAATAVTLRPVFVRPVVPPNVIPAEELLDRVNFDWVVSVPSAAVRPVPAKPAAVVVTVTLRPSAAVRVTKPADVTVAVTPVCDD